MLFLYGGAKRARRRASHRIAKLRGQLRCSFSLAPDYGSLTGKAPISPSAGALPLPCKQTNVALLFFSLSESLLTSDSPPHHKHTHTDLAFSNWRVLRAISPIDTHIRYPHIDNNTYQGFSNRPQDVPHFSSSIVETSWQQCYPRKGKKRLRVIHDCPGAC
jgi:hypothetical protein